MTTIQMPKLTTRQRHDLITEYIGAYQPRYKVAPTQREIANACGIPIATVADCLKNMRLAGRLVNVGTDRRPFYEIVDKPK